MTLTYARAAYVMSPGSIGMLRNYIFELANVDRSACVSEIDHFLAHDPDVGAELIARTIQLPHIEHTLRAADGLSIYASDNVYEPCFMYARYEVDAWERCERAWRLSGEQAPVECFGIAGAIAMVRRKFELATEYNDSCRKIRGFDPRTTAARFAGPFFDDIGSAASQLIDNAPKVEWQSQRPAKRRVMIGCDPKFYFEYGDYLRRSLKQSGTSADLHVHLFDRGAPMTVEDSGEETPFRSMKSAKFYYAAARLFRLWQIIARDPVPTIMLDADLFVNGSLDELFDRLEHCDAILCRMPGRANFHTQINASMVAINPAAGGMEFIRRVAAYILKVFTSGEKIPWCLDQIALNCVLWQMDEARYPLKVQAAGSTVYDGTLDDGVLLWPQKVAADDPNVKKWEQACVRFGKGNIHDARP